MARSAKQDKVAGKGAKPPLGKAASLGGMLARNPVLVGGSTAFLVAFSYVSANALWYQPHAHASAFFATRDLPRFVEANGNQLDYGETETTITIERPEAPAAPALAPVAADPVTKQVQQILKDLNFYDGAVDGIAGPNTRKAIETYQHKMGLTASGTVDALLLEQLGAARTTAGLAPIPRNRDPEPRTVAAVATTGEPGGDTSARIVKIQAGLKAFGNDGMEIDGVIGARTRAAIKEFQSLFGLPETGEPDEAVYVKMREIGLTN
jgi:peptidoglycan hydrolase-like protein with peptidoglycan-binding domain